MKILVTGSEGFVGSNLIPHLDRLGHGIRRYDEKLGYDINDKGKLIEHMKDVDVVIHLAGLRGPDCDFDGTLKEQYKSIFREAVRVVRVCRRLKKRLVYISSGAVYGTKLFNKPPGQKTPNGYIRHELPYPITDKTPYCDNPHPYSYWKAKASDCIAGNGGTVFYVNGLGIDRGLPDPWKTSFGNLAHAVDLAVRKNIGGKFNIADTGSRVNLRKARKVLGYKG